MNGWAHLNTLAAAWPVLQLSRSSGLTLALLDLHQLDTSLDAAINTLANTLKAQLLSTPGVRIGLNKDARLVMWLD